MQAPGASAPAKASSSGDAATTADDESDSDVVLDPYMSDGGTGVLDSGDDDEVTRARGDTDSDVEEEDETLAPTRVRACACVWSAGSAAHISTAHSLTTQLLRALRRR